MTSSNLFPKINFGVSKTGISGYHGVTANSPLRKGVTEDGEEFYEIAYPIVYENIEQRNTAFDAIIKKWSDGRKADSLVDYKNSETVEDRDSRILYEVRGMRHSLLADLAEYAKSKSADIFADMVETFISAETIKYRCFLAEPEKKPDGTEGVYEEVTLIALRRTASESHGFVRNLASMQNLSIKDGDAQALPLLEVGTVVDCNYTSTNEEGLVSDNRFPILFIALSLEYHSLCPGFKEVKTVAPKTEAKPATPAPQPVADATTAKTEDTAEKENVFPDYKSNPLEKDIEMMILRYMKAVIDMKYGNVIMSKNSSDQGRKVAKAREHYEKKVALWAAGAGDTPEKKNKRAEKFKTINQSDSIAIREFVHSLYYGLYNTCAALDDIPTIKVVAKFLGVFLDSGVFPVSVLRYFLDIWLDLTPEQRQRIKDENKIMLDIIALNESQQKSSS